MQIGSSIKRRGTNILATKVVALKITTPTFEGWEVKEGLN